MKTFLLAIFVAALTFVSCQLYADSFLKSISLFPNLNGLSGDLTFQEDPGEGFELTISIKSLKTAEILWEGRPELEPGRLHNEKALFFQVKNLHPEHWTPANPVLYECSFHFKRDQQALPEEISVRTGFRRLSTENGQIFLNDKPIFLRGIAINPPGRGIPKEVEESREFALEYVRFMKSLHVNIIRIPDREIWYDVCDELGMMVFGGNYSGSVNGERPPKNYEEGVAWYKNSKFQPLVHHPSLVIYALTNEVPYRGQIAQKWVDFLSYAHRELKKWDDTRLYIGNAGYGYGQSGDICDLHRYWGWYYSSPYTFLHIRDYEKITSPEKAQPLTFTECVGNYTGPDGRYNLTPNHKNPVSQLNWTGHAPQPVQQLLADEHQSWVFKQATELIRRLRKINPESSGVFPFTIMFRNWHTATNLVEMDPKPVTRQARRSYQPVLLSWENWQPQIYAGSTIRPIAHIINDSDDFTDLKNNQLIVRIMDESYSTVQTDTIPIPDIAYYQIHSENMVIPIPENLFSGYYKLEGIVLSGGVEVSRNHEELFISPVGRQAVSPGIISVYDPSGATMQSLRQLGYAASSLQPADISSSLKLLVIGRNSIDEVLFAQAAKLKEWIGAGGRLLILSQEQEHQSLLKQILPVAVDFPHMNIDDPSYPPPPRPSRNSFNVNPERPHHLVFKGITRKELKVWSDYTGWDETKNGFPAVYPVTNGFTLQKKTDKENVAVLANYSVGLEGIALAEFFSGAGSTLLSGFDLINRTGMDPIADQLLLNLIQYAAKPAGHERYPLIDSPIIWGEYETEKGILDGITSGLMLNARPALFGSYEDLPILLEKEGHMYAGAKWGWNNRAGKQYVPYGRRIFGPYFHRDFGGVPTPVAPESTTGQAFFWCRVPPGKKSMRTLVWNPSPESLPVKIGLNESMTEEYIAPNEYKWIETPFSRSSTTARVALEGDRRLVVLETFLTNADRTYLNAYSCTAYQWITKPLKGDW